MSDQARRASSSSSGLFVNTLDVEERRRRALEPARRPAGLARASTASARRARRPGRPRTPRAGSARRSAASCSRTTAMNVRTESALSAQPGRGAGAPGAALRSGRKRAARAAGGRGRRRARTARRDRRRRDGGRDLEPAQGLPGRSLRLGVLRPRAQPLAPVVLDGGVRQPHEGARRTGAATRRSVPARSW